jgi:hypothetical protein
MTESFWLITSVVWITLFTISVRNLLETYDV